MKNYLFLLNSILYVISICCLAQNINLTNHQKTKNELVLKYHKKIIKKDCKLWNLKMGKDIIYLKYLWI